MQPHGKWLTLILTLLLALAGCVEQGATDDLTDDGDAAGTPDDGGEDLTDVEPELPAYQAMGFDGETWPRLDGVTLTILDHGAFGGFDDAAALFENLTGAHVEHVEADDTGSALNRAIQEKGKPTFDVIYGIDNGYYTVAVDAGIFEPYKPLLSENIATEYVFFDADGTWYATPVDHGYIALNWDPNHDSLENVTIESLDDVREHADKFVTQDPRTSTPGLGFLLTTIATYGTENDYTWQDYWQDLFDRGVLVTAGWSEAYEQHFSAGYGIYYGGLADKPIVTSYTTSPAYEHYYERPVEDLAEVLLAPQSTFHQIQTMGIAKGTENLAAAQAWIEFTLTEDFQNLAAPKNAIYPVVPGVETDSTYGDVDPAPGTFEPAGLDHETIGTNLQGWIQTWVDLCEQNNCA